MNVSCRLWGYQIRVSQDTGDLLRGERLDNECDDLSRDPHQTRLSGYRRRSIRHECRVYEQVVHPWHESVDILHDVGMAELDLRLKHVNDRAQYRMRVRRARFQIFIGLGGGIADEVELGEEPHGERLEEVRLLAELRERSERAPVLDARGLVVTRGRTVGERAEEEGQRRLRDVPRRGGRDSGEQIEGGVTVREALRRLLVKESMRADLMSSFSSCPS